MNAPIAGIDERVRRLPFKGREAVREALETAEWFAANPPVSLPPQSVSEIAQAQNLRGYSTWQLLAEIQRLEDEAEIDEWMVNYSQALCNEVKRRSAFELDKNAQAKRVELMALKERCVGEEFLSVCSHYAEVGRDGKFRCRIHGEDTDPSGVIYALQGKWWCFGCNRGGDIFDFLMTYGRLTFGEAAALLGKLYGFKVGRGNGE